MPRIISDKTEFFRGEIEVADQEADEKMARVEPKNPPKSLGGSPDSSSRDLMLAASSAVI
jgi:hypothetical protein